MHENRFISTLAATLVYLSLLGPLFGAAQAETLVEPGTCELIVASRQTLSEARSYARSMENTQFAKIFLASNGWYAISVGALRPNEEEPVIRDWKSSGRIPQDSYCSRGLRYIARFDWRTGEQLQTNTRQTTRNESVYFVNSPGDGYLNLRSGPGSEYNIIREMSHGDRVVLLSSSGNWRRVRHNASGAVGWAYKNYLQTSAPSQSQSLSGSQSRTSSNSGRSSSGGGGINNALIGFLNNTIDAFENANSSSSSSSSSTSSIESYCYSISDSDARNACLLEPWLTENEDARNIILGNCYVLSNWANDFGLRYVCAEGGKNACSAIDDSDVSYSCYSCNGSRRWAATAAAGHVFQCY